MGIGVGGVERTLTVLDEIKAERDRQDAKWGDQSASKDGTGPLTMPLLFVGASTLGSSSAQRLANLAKERTDQQARTPHGASMASILLEEVFEAMAEDRAERLRAELIQVAAVAVAWCEYLDKRGAN